MERYTIRRQIMEQLLVRRGDLTRVAQAAGIAPSAISEWRAGKNSRRLGDEQLDRLARSRGMVWMLVPAQPAADGNDGA